MPSATIKWSPVKGAQGYQVFRSQPINPKLITGTSFTDLTVQRGQTYLYEVRAYENGAVSMESHPAEVTIKP